MNWVAFWIILGFTLGNLSGMGLFHWTYKKQHPEPGYWKDDVEFWLFTTICTFAGISYLMVRAFTGIKKLIDRLK